ncbi:uncharacterized protein PgNI_12184 [Pyricularia grisea]|uniref:Uncharacterized protein n=1 Tax=Pyricularia grisea TaxID=148305 RepID=A0A6P8AQV4_PYRGI|nr:uncharacterized protein PgNI_12184 [Pyricularia grisea]TLD04442.1 hypothetical protein PgNI_12184 [Pyricularia grisea]
MYEASQQLEKLRKKFLDSFALIYFTLRVGGDIASAVCLEQGHPNGNVLRLARNFGVPPDFVDQLQLILHDLTAVASKEKSVKDGEFEILLKIIKLTGNKIWSLLEQFHDPKIHATVRRKISALRTDETYLDNGEKADF